MNVALISFTERGAVTAGRLAAALAGEGNTVSCVRGFGSQKVDHAAWAAEEFAHCDALVFVGAAGIAVRTVAPLLVSKTSDPAVIVVDESCSFCIPLLSGHIGGANALAEQLASLCGATPVITTATDVAGVFAVDTWAVGQGLAIANPERIKDVSAALLAAERVTCFSEHPIAGSAPEGVELVADVATEVPDLWIGAHAPLVAHAPLALIPQNMVLGIGCRRGTSLEQIAAAVDSFLAEHGVSSLSVRTLASIELKAEEPGILQLVSDRGWDFKTFTADELNAVAGEFSPSSFVSEVTGTDNVCERSVAATGAEVVVPKEIVDGVALALGTLPLHVAWPKEPGL